MRSWAITLVCTYLMGAASFAISFTSPLSYDTAGLVGTIDGKLANNSPSTQLMAAQALLDVVGLGAVSGVYTTGNLVDYSDTLNGDVNQTQGTALSIPVGYDYVLAKYGGKNAGYVLFYLGGQSATIPQYPYSFWSGKTKQYALSGWTVWNGSSRVPDGGATVMLLGTAIVVLGIIRRFLKSD